MSNQLTPDRTRGRAAMDAGRWAQDIVAAMERQREDPDDLRGFDYQHWFDMLESLLATHGFQLHPPETRL